MLQQHLLVIVCCTLQCFKGFLNISNAAKGAVSRSHVRVLINVKTTVRGLGLGLGFRVT